MVTLELDYPPSWNHFFSYVRGRPVLSKEARAYRQQVRRQIAASGAKPLMGPLAVRIEISPPDQRRRDCDNAQKTILDALQNGGAFWDDSQIVWLLTIKSAQVSGGKATVSMKVMDDIAHPSAMPEFVD
ncbi:MAG: RusA family crossover junction endodeoxyribonuclease [Pirellulaceae bacterium]|nr:RusA family crossover junction endodeoxyribonuclease [Pirellulaceae bacterium]